MFSRLQNFALHRALSQRKLCEKGCFNFGTRFFFSTKGENVECADPNVDIKYTEALIDGKFIKTEKTMENIDPRTGKSFCQISMCNEHETQMAIDSARNAFDNGIWTKLAGSERSKLLRKLADLLEQNRDYIAMLETYDTGKPITESHFDVDLSIELLNYFSGYATDMPYYSESGNFGLYNLTLEPLGVVACIVPWNYPIMEMAFKVATGLACGNACIVKPSETASLTCIYAGYLCLEAGFPNGIVNIVPGLGNTVGTTLVESDKVDKVSFTGSVVTAKKIMKAINPPSKKMTLELGGKSAVIINDDIFDNSLIDIAQLFVGACFLNAGQVCTAPTRLFIHEKIYDEFVENVINLTKKNIKIGDPFDKNTTLGCVQNEMQFNKVLNVFEQTKNGSLNKKPRLCYGGNRVGETGYFIEPTIFSDVEDDMLVAKEEIFGPSMQILKFSDINEAFRRANKETPYGLAAGFFSRNVDLCNRAARELQAGTVFINLYDVWDASLPFGGYKQSGFGREKGQDSIKWFTKQKTILHQYRKKSFE